MKTWNKLTRSVDQTGVGSEVRGTNCGTSNEVSGTNSGTKARALGNQEKYSSEVRNKGYR